MNLKTTKMLKIKGIKPPNENTAGLSTSYKKRFTMKNTKSIAQASNDFKGLQNTLQEAGKIPVSRPPPTNFEKILMLENNHNVYYNALFSMQVAISKPNIVEQKSLLLESFEYLKKSTEDEEKLKKIIIENSASVKIVDHLMNNENRGEEKHLTPPFNVMSRTRYLRKTIVPPKPVMVSRSSTTITMKLPYFRPQTDHKDWRNIHKMALFGKESGSGVAVSLNNTEFPGTGTKVDPGSVITVSNLIPNRKYVFA